MKARVVLLFWTMLSAAGCLAQEPESYTKDYKHALRYGAKAKMTLHIIDETGMPVSNAAASVVFLPPKAISNTVVRGLSDEKGLFVAEGVSTKAIGGYVSKDRYYSTNFKCPRGNPADPYDSASKVKGDRWLPWNPTVPVVLREIRNPVPMYVKSVDHILPKGVSIGFDCAVGEFLPPVGKGEVADFNVLVEQNGVLTKDRKFSKRMILQANSEGGGFAFLKTHSASAFKSEHQAPLGDYAGSVDFYAEYPPPSASRPTIDPFASGKYMVFRSRVERDDEGNIIKANYGKIYETIEYGRNARIQTDGESMIRFLYYFNPTPNDRNLEFDGKNNLFKPGWNSNLNWSREP